MTIFHTFAKYTLLVGAALSLSLLSSSAYAIGDGGDGNGGPTGWCGGSCRFIIVSPAMYPGNITVPPGQVLCREFHESQCEPGWVQDTVRTPEDCIRRDLQCRYSNYLPPLPPELIPGLIK